MKRHDMETFFRLVSYPKVRGNPPQMGSTVRYLASFAPGEFFQAHKYVNKLKAADTKHVTRRIYLDDSGYLYHVEQDRPKERPRV